MLRASSLLLIGWLALASCESEQVLVDRIVHDTIWVQSPPVKVVETQTDTVWVTQTVHDTITVTKQIVVTDTVLLERVVQVVDTVYKEVVKTITVTEFDTVYVTRTEIVDSRLTIVRPGATVDDGSEEWNSGIAYWLDRVQRAGLRPKATTVIFSVHLGHPEEGEIIWNPYENIYHVILPYEDRASVWRALSHILLDIPFIEPPEGEWFFSFFWWEDEEARIVKPEFDHLMFVYFPSELYWSASKEKQDWYWNDMFGL